MRKIIRLASSLCIMLVFGLLVFTIPTSASSKDAYIESFSYGDDGTKIKFQNDQIPSFVDGNGIKFYELQKDTFVYVADILLYKVKSFTIYIDSGSAKVTKQNGTAIPAGVTMSYSINITKRGWAEYEITSEDGSTVNTYYFLNENISDSAVPLNYWDAIPALDKVKIKDKGALEVIKQEYAKRDDKDEAIVKLIDDDLARIDDLEKADVVAKEIEAISEDAPDDDMVKKAREDFNALTPDQQALITDDAKTKLATAEEKIATEVKALIEALPIDGSDADAVANARDAYNSLTDEEKEYVKDSENTLIAAEEAVVAKKKEEEDKTTAEDFSKIIAALKGDGTDSDAAIAAAKVAYEALSPEAKEMAKEDFAKLTAAEKAVVAKKEADKAANAVKKGDSFKIGKNNYKVTKISGKAGEVSFVNCTSNKLTKVSIPDTVNYKGYNFKVTAIQSKALKGYKKLTTVTIGKNVISIGANAFNGDAKLKKITVKSTGLKKVGAKALKGIHKKAVIKVPKKMLKKYKKIFKGKGQKKTVKIK